jgi:hypothetical protein
VCPRIGGRCDHPGSHPDIACRSLSTHLRAKFLPPDALEAVSLCNRPDAKVLYLGADASAPPLKKTWKETMAELDRAVQRFKIKIARLAEDSECN